jgi:hypothetical protein
MKYISKLVPQKICYSKLSTLYLHYASMICISVNLCSKETGRCFTIMKSFSIVFVYWTICMPECFGTYFSMLVHFKPVGAFSQPDVIDFVQLFIRLVFHISAEEVLQRHRRFNGHSDGTSSYSLLISFKLSARSRIYAFHILLPVVLY